MKKIDFKTNGFDENPNQILVFRTIKQVMETIQPDQVNDFVADFHTILRIFSEQKAKQQSLKFKGFKWKPNSFALRLSQL